MVFEMYFNVYKLRKSFDIGGSNVNCIDKLFLYEWKNLK